MVDVEHKVDTRDDERDDISGSMSTGPMQAHDRAGDLEEPAGPSRYQRVEQEERTFLVCQDAPRIQLTVERGLTVDESSRKKYPKRSIFLDGAYDGAPFLDNEARQYSLDHHSGCVRQFTLATCEQAAVLLAQGLPLGEGTWHLYVNAPDLDALLASWLLMNHSELTRDPAIFADVMPFVRVEGTIDAHGFDQPVLAGLPLPVFEMHKKRIDEVLAEEQQLKSEERWGKIDWLDYSARMLRRLDQLLYPAGYLNNLVEMTEVAQAQLAPDKIAVLCRSRQGIYAVEAHLKKRYDKQLAIIVLDAGGGTFTLRQTDPFLQKNLESIYALLNKRDPAVRGPEKPERGDKPERPEKVAGEEAKQAEERADGASGDEAPADNGNRWGGSADIGGSPRATGSSMTGEDVLGVVREVFGGGGWLRRMVRRITRIGHG